MITVKPGETLSLIAQRILGRASAWPVLAGLNGLRDPDLIVPGQRLKTPVSPPPRYSRCGKEVLDDGQHMADSENEAAAELIVSALNSARRMAEFGVMGWERFGD